MYSKLLIEIILKIEYDEKARKIFTNYFREQYAHDNSCLQMIDQFERDYQSNRPIWWYTKEMLIYSLLSKALRLLDVDLIIKMGFFIQDLHRQIEQLHSKTQYTTKLIVY